MEEWEFIIQKFNIYALNHDFDIIVKILLFNLTTYLFSTDTP